MAAIKLFCSVVVLTLLSASCKNEMNKQNDLLIFDASKYEVQSLDFEGTVITVRAFENISYCTNPVDSVYQKMNIYIPEIYFQGGKINDYTAETAPIFYPNQVGGYMPAQPATFIPANERRPMGDRPNTVAFMLSKGYVVASAGARGRTLKDQNGLFTGKSPAAIVDLKAGVRYLKYNDAQMPGDANKIISNGTSAGGAMSSLLGATGNHPDYEPYLKELGAAEGTDDIFAAQCYCPIINLEHADMAYEWQFNGINTFEKREWGTPNVTEVDLTAEQIQISNELKVDFPAYVNGLDLKDETGKSLTLEEDGSGSFKEWVKKYIIASAQTALNQGDDLSLHSWIEIKDGKVIDLDYSAYIRYMKRMKTPPAFDGLDMASPENQEFGTASIDKQHFTAFGVNHSKIEGATMAEMPYIKMLNPMYYIGNPEAKTATNWRIRHGAKDKDTSLGIPVILTTVLQNQGYDVDFALPWDRPHSGDYDLEELAAWIDSIVR